MKKLLISFVMLAMVIGIVGTIHNNPVAHAQDGTIAYGETVQGEATADALSTKYTFTGTAGDVVIAYSEPLDFDSSFQPKLTLAAPDGTVLAVRAGFFSAEVAALLPADGEYTIQVETESADYLGAYTLTLNNVQVLNVAETVSGTMTQDDTVYYAVVGLSTFTVEFAREGTFAPQLTLSKIDINDLFEEQGFLTEVAILGGENMRAGSMTLDGLTDVTIIKLGTGLFSFYFEDVSADYTLTITE